MLMQEMKQVRGFCPSCHQFGIIIRDQSVSTIEFMGGEGVMVKDEMFEVIYIAYDSSEEFHAHSMSYVSLDCQESYTKFLGKSNQPKNMICNFAIHVILSIVISIIINLCSLKFSLHVHLMDQC